MDSQFTRHCCIDYALQRLDVGRKENATASASGRKITYHDRRTSSPYQATEIEIVYVVERDFSKDMPRTHGYMVV